MSSSDCSSFPSASSARKTLRVLIARANWSRGCGWAIRTHVRIIRMQTRVRSEKSDQDIDQNGENEGDEQRHDQPSRRAAVHTDSPIPRSRFRQHDTTRARCAS
jgi:hypothetical protein